MDATVFDKRLSFLGEGPMWHPEAEALFWFDILNATLHRRVGEAYDAWSFPDCVSAGGWVDRQTLFIAGAAGFFTLDTETGTTSDVAPPASDPKTTRSNDGRADPQGGFWIGTMGRNAESRAGAIHRYYKGEVRTLFERITIPNAICFAPDGGHAFFTDTADGRVWRQRLNAAGWPQGERELYLDFRGTGLNPDGAVVDAEGAFWNAQWGAGRVARYLPDGSFDAEVRVGAAHSSCPAFGGPSLQTLYVTTAQEHMSEDDLANQPLAGAVFSVETPFQGQAEHRVIL